MPLLTLKEIETFSPVFCGKLGNSFARFLMKILKIDRCNDLYDSNAHLRGPAFARSVLETIGVKYEVINGHYLDRLPDGPFVTISNHPYGGIDGIILVDMFGHLRKDYRVMVNKFLSRIESLDESFICVTPVGKETDRSVNENINGVRRSLSHVRNGNPLGLFPSGAVSDLSLKDRNIRDRQWQEPMIRLIRKLKVPILPVKFMDRNSDFYYSLGLIDWKIRLLRLPSEVFNKRGKTVRVALGPLIDPADIEDFDTINDLRCYLRNSVYDLK